VNALQTVHVRINDAATGQPAPCRVRFTDARGTYYAPLGRLTEFATDVGIDVGGNLLLDGQAHAAIDGTCEILLPPGRIAMTANKGPEYRPLRAEVGLAPGKLALRFELERWTDLRAERWYSGDTRCHFLTPHAALLEAAAEDVAVVNLLCRESPAYGATEKVRALQNVLAFSGQRPALEKPGHMVVVGSMNLDPTLGRLLLLNCHRVVYPLTFGGPGAFDAWTLADWCDQCHRKAGLVIGEGFFGQAPGNPHGELLADLILGKVDALNYNARGQENALEEWYVLLDLGFRVPLTAGSGKDSNACALGAARTYARLESGQDFTYKNWIEAVRAGRTFVTSGPLLLLTVESRDPGAVIDLPSAAPTVHIRAEARSLGPLEALEVVANHAVVARASPPLSPSPILEAELTLPAGGWLTARCRGPEGEAQTSPVYMRVEGQRRPANPTALTCFTEYLEKMLEWVARDGRFESDAQRQRLAGIFRGARTTLVERRL